MRSWLLRLVAGSVFATAVSALTLGATPADGSEATSVEPQRYVVMESPEALDEVDPAVARLGGAITAASFPQPTVADQVAAVVGAGPIERLETIDAAVVELTAEQIETLRADPRLIVERDIEVGVAENELPWGVDRLDQTSPELDGRFAARFDGGGVRIFVVDSGVRADHQQLAGRVVDGFDLFDETSSGTTDCHGHGTHVASVVAGNTVGVAPGATIVPVRVLDCSGQGHTSGVARAVDWIIANHEAPGVINMSIGGEPSDVLDAAIARAHAVGFVVVAAAGNSADDACETSPARAAEAITVGAVGRNDVYASWSNKGPCVDMAAPGLAIVGANARSGVGLRTMSGTSQAAPHVAALAAMLIQSGVVDPAAVAAELEAAAHSAGVVVATGDGAVVVATLPERVRHHVSSLDVGVAESPTPVITASVTTDADVRVLLVGGPEGPDSASASEAVVVARPTDGTALATFAVEPGRYRVQVAGFGFAAEVVASGPAETQYRIDGALLGLEGVTLLIGAAPADTPDGGLRFGPTGRSVDLVGSPAQ
ncbi:MAG: S8 family peptidase [Acidimicrobiales bacterium]|nr:S8 family peptidase [Acidimicrobiales bacterium]